MNRLEACCCWQQPPKPASSRSWNRRCHLLPILSAFHGSPAQRCADTWYSPSCCLRAVGLQRTWDLRGYTADGLALLTGRTHAYGYRYTEAFLSQVACADGAECFTNTLACWTT